MRHTPHRFVERQCMALRDCACIVSNIFSWSHGRFWQIYEAKAPLGRGRAVSRDIHFFEEHVIVDIGIIGADKILAYWPISVAFTTFCVVALINALNFIDGINGLASGKTMVAAFALLLLANQYDEPNLTLLGTAIFSATFGLFMLNFPQGRIFLSDAGAYTLGFLLAVSFITLQSKNSEISAWAIMLIIFWPIVDMAHAILRRRLKRNRADRPDFILLEQRYLHTDDIVPL